MKKQSAVAVAAMLAAAFSAAPLQAQTPPDQEMRGVWISTAFGLDFPGGVGTNPTNQRNRILTLLDEAEAAGLNTVIFQIRAEGDAFYVSNYEPWSRWLSNSDQGTAPTRAWDPFQFVIDECRRRGLEVHAWMNPYRMGIDPTEDYDADHPENDQPGIVVDFEDDDADAITDYLWLNPGDPATDTYNLQVIDDVVSRYDIDALHFDDYFYPYGIDEGGATGGPFPDSTEFATYGGVMTLADWRRDNINNFIQSVQSYLTAEPGKGHVRLGLSPSGIWRTGVAGAPSGISGLNSYSAVYADSREWLQQGWVDYLAPQLYWGRNADGFSSSQDYDTLHDWWTNSTQNPLGRLVIPGLPAYKITTGSPVYEAADIVSMVTYTQADSNSSGNLFFRADNMDLAEGLESPLNVQLAATPYAVESTTPPATWLDNTAPTAPTVAFDGDAATGYTVYWTPAGSEFSQWYIVYWEDAGGWEFDVVPAWQRQYDLPGVSPTAPFNFAVASLDRVGNSSSISVVDLTGLTPNPVPTPFSATLVQDFEGTFSIIQGGGSSGVTLNTSTDTTEEYNNRLDPRIDTPDDESWVLDFDWSGGSGGTGRFSTSGQNPAVDLTQGFGFYIKVTEGELDIATVIRETGGSGPIGSNGGTSGTLERTDFQRVTASPNWQYVYFDLPSENYTGYLTGNGTLDGTWGVWENLLVNQVSTDPTTSFRIWIDDVYQGDAHTKIGEPMRPRSLGGATNFPNGVDLSWDANLENDIAGYRIYRSTSPDVEAIDSNFVTETTSTSYTDSGLSSGATYYYIITAVDSEGNESLISDEITQAAALPVTLDAFVIE